jgi:hypothetical protein
MVDDIKRLSIPSNNDGNVVESHHKDEKNNGKRTQMRSSLLDKQTSVKRTEHMLMEKAYHEFHPPQSLFQYVQSSAVEETESNSDDYLSAKKMAYIQKDGLCFTTAKGNVSKKVHSMHELEYLIHQINDFFETIFRNTILPDTGIGIYTRLKLIQKGETEVQTDGEMETVLYRGDPFWISSHGAIQENKTSDVFDSLYKPDPWHDFAYIEWRTSSSDKPDDVTVIPGWILFFFQNS